MLLRFLRLPLDPLGVFLGLQPKPCRRAPPRSWAHPAGADVARLWRDRLGQGLYVVTNGAEGRPLARRSLAQIAEQPELVSQVKLNHHPG